MAAGLLHGQIAAGEAPPDQRRQAQRTEINGRPYRIIKQRAGDQSVTYIASGQTRLTQQRLRESIALEQPRIIAPALAQRITNAENDELIAVIVLLRDQPAGPISRQIAAQVQPLINERGMNLRAGWLQARADRAAGDHAAGEGAGQPEAQARRDLARQIDDLRRQMIRDIHQQSVAAVAPSQAAITQFINQLGGQVIRSASVMNMVAAHIPAARISLLADHPLVAGIDLDFAVAPELDLQRQSLGVDTTFWANGITGGVFDCGVLDTGVQQNHPALSSHTFLSNMGANDPDPFGHGTGVAGIMASTDSAYRGIAFGLDTIVVAEASSSISISMVGMDYIASTGEPENVNYSFGNVASPSDEYTPIDQFFDGVIDSFGFMVTKSAGNGGYHATNPTITHPAHAYNLIAVGNMNDQDTVTRDDDRIDATSSVGPTSAGRKKPDLTAPGANTMTCTPVGGFVNMGGTSAAAPHVGAGVILLADLGVTDPLAAKAILINSADAITDNGTASAADDAFVSGSLWNRRYGWGYLNLGRAYEHGLEFFSDAVPWQPEDADFKLYRGPAAAFDKFTLVWNRHVAYNGAMFPTQIESLSDLDLFAYRESDNVLIASSTSAIDNVEQFHIPGIESSVVVKVEAAAAFDPDIQTERFALATYGGMADAAGPAFTAAFTHPPKVQPNAIFSLSVTITNAGDVAAHVPAVEFSGMTVLDGANPAAVATLAPGAQASVQWLVQAPASAAPHPVTVAVSTNSYGEVFADSIQAMINVTNCAADITGDSQVSVPDLLAVVNAWGACAPPPSLCAADVNHDGQVNVGDLIAVINAWGGCR